MCWPEPTLYKKCEHLSPVWKKVGDQTIIHPDTTIRRCIDYKNKRICGMRWTTDWDTVHEVEKKCEECEEKEKTNKTKEKGD
jgi:hypothetical protein